MAGTVARDSAFTRGFKAVGHFVNPALLPIVGTGVVPIWAVVRHRGRRSGRTYSTPVAVLPTADGFLIPLPFSERTDWCRNLLNAGGGVMTWKRADWVISGLEIVDATAAAGYPALLRFGVRALGIKHFLKARRTPA